jgi:hypothetical protein
LAKDKEDLEIYDDTVNASETTLKERSKTPTPKSNRLLKRPLLTWLLTALMLRLQLEKRVTLAD